MGTDAATKIVVDCATATLSAIAVGDQARALYDSTTLIAATIEAVSPHHELAEIEGQVTAVTASSLTITPEGNRALADFVTLALKSLARV